MQKYKNNNSNELKKREYISELPFVDTFNNEEIESMVKYSQFIHLKKGTVLRNGRTDRNEILMILNGKMRVVLLSDEGKEVTIRLLSDNDLLFHFDKPIIFDNTKYTTEVDEDTDILRIDLSSSIYEKNYVVIMEFVLRQFKQYFDVLSNSLMQTLSTNLETRIANLLLKEAKQYKKNELKLTHAQIASYLNSSREQVSRILGQFADDYLIELGYGKIRIIDFDGLREYLIDE